MKISWVLASSTNCWLLLCFLLETVQIILELIQVRWLTHSLTYSLTHSLSFFSVLSSIGRRSVENQSFFKKKGNINSFEEMVFFQWWLENTREKSECSLTGVEPTTSFRLSVRMLYHLAKRADRKNPSAPLLESNIRPSDYQFGCSTTNL